MKLGNRTARLLFVAALASCDPGPVRLPAQAAESGAQTTDEPICARGRIPEQSGQCRPWVSSRRLREQVVGHTATALEDGRILVVGGARGADASSVFDTAFLYEPVGDVWSELPPLEAPIAGHSATRLADGSVLVAGGLRHLSPSGRAYRFDPHAGSWRPVADMAEARAFHAAVRLPDGSVLVTGGQGADGPSLDTAERYDAATDRWLAAASMYDGRRRHTLTRLDDGRVLAVGGRPSPHQDDHAHAPPALDTAAVYDAVTNRWRQVAPMLADRGNHRAALLSDGRVLVVGGLWDPGRPAELFDPTTEQWASAGFLDPGRNEMTLSPSTDERLAVIGGFTPGRGALGDVALFGAGDSAFVALGSLRTRRARHRAAPLGDGRLLLVGGIWDGPDGATSIVEVGSEGLTQYGPAALATAPWPGDAAPGERPARVDGDGANLAGDGLYVLDGDGLTDRVWRYDLAAASWTPLPPLPEPADGVVFETSSGGELVARGPQIAWRLGPGAPRWLPAPVLVSDVVPLEPPVPALLNARTAIPTLRWQDGRQLAAGGTMANGEATRSVEVLDPGATEWRIAASLVDERRDHSATLLPDGRALLAGGRNKNGLLDSWLTWDPVSETWSEPQPLANGRAGHVAFALPDGRVLLVGGESQEGAPTELIAP